VRLLEAAGVIRSYVAVIDQAPVNLPGRITGDNGLHTVRN
jgi:hypothetical protein